MTKLGRYRWLEHGLFWCVYVLVQSLHGGLYDSDFGKMAMYVLTDLPLTVVVTYLAVYAVLPLYFQGRRIASLLAGSLLLVTALFASRLLMQHLQFPLFYRGSEYTFIFFNWYKIVGDLVGFVAIAGMVAGLKYFRDWRRTKDRVEALSAEKRAAELSFLRAQVHPHFLFNTLNSIYYEVLKKSDAAPDLIIRLCDILRFILYECKDAFIPVEKELTLIRDYIALEQSRFGERLVVDLQVKGAAKTMVPPLVCFSLVENAFKHGTSNHKDRIAIRIELVLMPDRLKLTVQNPYTVAAAPDDLGATKGIGLQNVRQQLDLMFGAGHVLSCAPIGDLFVSTLEIPTSTRSQ